MPALTERDLNRSSTAQTSNEQKSNAIGEENKTQEPQEVQQHRQILEQKIAENNGKPGQNYISPSDAILSPASSKLANMKQRQMDKQNGKNPLARTLFSRTASTCSNASAGDEGSEDKQ